MDWDPSATATDGYVCPPCPEFHPTWDEFQHPLKYIASIRHIGMQAGICKIVPPAGWQPPFAINEKTFRFRTRVQQLNCIDGHTRTEGNFVETLRMFLYRQGTPMQELPRVNSGELLNLYALFKNVSELGGYSAVCDGNLWSQVVRRVGRSAASDRPSPALCQQYKEHYEACLLAYERRREQPQFQTPDVKKTAKKSTSSTAVSAASSTTPTEKTRSSMKKKQPRDKETTESHADDDALMSPSAKRVKRTLFSDGGHTSSEESDSLSVDTADETKRTTRGKSAPKRVKPVKEDEEVDEEEDDDDDDDDIEMDEDEEYEESEKKKPKQARKTAAELEPRALKPDPKRRIRLDPPEVFTGQRFYHFIPDEHAKIGEVQRVVRGKKPHVFVKYDDGTRDTIDLATMQLVLANGWNAEAAEVAFKSELCQTCLRGDCWDQLLLCDSCNGGHHLFCLDEPLKEVPKGDWYCDQCVQESLEPARENNPKFGFEMGSEYTLAAYKEKADNWKASYFGTKTDEEAEKISDKELEQEYWRILSTPLHEQRLEVEYGSDIDSGSMGSGFPRPDDYLKSMKVLSRRLQILSERKGATPAQRKLCEVFSRGIDEAVASGSTAELEELLKKYAMDGWNLNNLPKFPGSVLQHLDEDIKGVMVPWVYIGMCFSTFCWHVEDHNFYSISYLHRGAPKTWYGVPCGKAEYFESVMKKLTPELFGSQPDLHLQLVTMFSPKTLIEHGVPVYRATHRPNEFIVTFPSAYHGGFNNGFNCAEAVNFATVDWLSWGAKSVSNYRNFSKLPVFAHEALVVSLAETVLESHSFDYETTKHYLVPAVEQLVKDWNAFEDSVGANRITRRETMAEYARRHGMSEADTNVAASANMGSHMRSCKMATKAGSTDSPEKVDDKKSRAGMKRERSMSKMPPLTTRPTRMVLWAGNSGKADGLRCSSCKQYCYLQAVVCTRCRHHSSVGCMEHYPAMCKCDAEEHYVYLHRYERNHLVGLLEGIGKRLLPIEDWLMDYDATFQKSGSAKPPVSLAKKLLSVALQCGGVPKEKLDELDDTVEAAVKWTETTQKLMSGSSASDFLPDLARLLSTVDHLGVIPDGIERVEKFLGEWTTCKTDAERFLGELHTVQHTEALPSAFDIQNESQDTELLWSENERHLDAIRRLVNVADRAEAIGQPLPRDLADRIDEAKQYLRVLIAANEMLAVISRFTKARATALPSPAGSGSGPNTPQHGPADVAVIMESDCRHVIMQADALERDAQLSIFKIKILRSLLRVTEAESEDLNYALDDYSKSFEELDSLWRRLRALPICPSRLDELGKRLTLCKSWEHRAKKLVDAVTRTASAAAARQAISWDDVLARPDLEEAERFYGEADQHFVPVSSFVRRQMHARLQDCRRWYATIHSLFVRPPLTPESPSLPQFLRSALETALNPPTHPMSAPSSMQLYCICDQVLCEHASYVNCTRCQLLFHTQCVSHPVGATAPFLCTGCSQIPPAPRSYIHTKRQIPSPPYPMFCMCRGPEDSSMICCDVCDEWYHSGCIGMTAEEMNQAEAYRCPRCAIRQNLYYLDKKALRRSALGRRPAVSRIDAMLVQLQTTLIALPPGTHELLQYLRHVKDVETRVRMYVTSFSSDFSVASFTSLDYRAEEQKLLSLMRELTNLEVHLESAIGNLSAIHWSLRACELVLGCHHAPKYSHLVILLDDAKHPNFVFPRPEYHHIQQTIEDRVVRATQWLKLAKMLEEEQWNIERARKLVFQYHELAQFLELPASEVELVFRVAGEHIPSPPQHQGAPLYTHHAHENNSRQGRQQQRVV